GMSAISMTNEARVVEMSRDRVPSLILVDRRHAGFAKLRRDLPTHVLIVSIHEPGSMRAEEHCWEDLENGADFSLCNPALDILMALVRSALRRVHARIASPVHVADRVRFDLGNYQVIVDGEPKALTPKECKLFRTLLDSAGRVVLKHELMDVVWGEDY